MWKNRQFVLDFYFKEIFDKALVLLKQRAAGITPGLLEGDEPRYKALLTPVGYRIENVILMAALFQPLHLTPIFSDITRQFHRRRSGFVMQKIRDYCPDIIIEHVPAVAGHDQKHMEEQVVVWWEKMRAVYGSNERLAIDLTGGTKTMSVGAQNAAASLNIPAFYLGVDYDEDTLQAIPGTEMLIPMKVSPAQTDDKLVFVIMPFRSEFDGVYQAIEKAATPKDLKCIRADKEIFLGVIMDKVKENIAKGGILVADLTLDRPNVYYELGLAHAWKKKVILIRQSTTSIPFDLQHLKIAEYDPANLGQLTDTIVQHIEAISKETI